MKGFYIVFEGIVGTGKSTQSKKLLEEMKKRYPTRKVILTREPGGDEIAEHIRKAVQGTLYNTDMVPECEAYLYAASRAQTLRSVVKPILDSGGIVISDRSYISSVAYQGFARGLGVEKILEINRVAVDGLQPDMIIYIKLDPVKSLRRIFNKEGDKFEKENPEFFRKIEEGYDLLSKRPEFSKRWATIDGTGDIETVYRRIMEKISESLRLSLQ